MLSLTSLTLPLVWVLTDPRSLQERIRDYVNLKAVLYSLAQVIVIAVTYFSGKHFPWPNTLLDGLIVLVGITLFFMGIFLSVWAKVTMKSSWGMPAQHDIKRQNKIIRRGPFSFSRNPIYLGLILVISGYTLALRSYSVLFVPFIAFYFYRAILKEEKILANHFGKEYLEYKSKVRRFL